MAAGEGRRRYVVTERRNGWCCRGSRPVPPENAISRCLPLIAVMQPADFGHLDDLAELPSVDRPRIGRVHLEVEMCLPACHALRSRSASVPQTQVTAAIRVFGTHRWLPFGLVGDQEADTRPEWHVGRVFVVGSDQVPLGLGKDRRPR